MLYNTERPLTFDSFRGQKYIVESIRAQAINKKFFGVYVFGGHFGCGKTSMSRTLGLAANCEHPDENGNPCLECSHCKSILSGSMDIIEIDAATNTGVDSIRELRETVNFKPAELDRKFYIIDEVHMLSKGAFNALLKVLEEPPEFVTFILCTTEIEAIPATIRSRGACYFFEQLTCEELAEHVEEVARRNGIVLLEDAANMIAKYSQGAARNALSILDQVSSINSEVSAEMVQRLLGVSDNAGLFIFATELLSANTMGALSGFEKLSSSGKDFLLLCDDLIEIVTDAILYSIGGKGVVRNTAQYVEKIDALVSVSGSDRLCVLADHLHALKGELRVSPGKSTVLAAIIRLTMDSNNSIIALTNRIASLEGEVARLKSSGNMAASPTNRYSIPDEPDKAMDMAADVQQDSIEDKVFLQEDFNDGEDDETYEEAVPEEITFIEEMEASVANMAVEKEGETGLLKADHHDVDALAFDIFDMIDFGSAMTTTMPAKNVTAEQTSPVAKCITTEGLKETVRLVERIAIEHGIFATALKGCTIEEKDDGLHIKTTLSEVRRLVAFYREHYISNGFDAAKNIIVV